MQTTGSTDGGAETLAQGDDVEADRIEQTCF